MQSGTTQPESTSREYNALSHSNKRPRTSGRPLKDTRHQASSGDAIKTGRRALRRSSPQPGSSREMTPSGDAATVKYTRTGRVSRANKGKRVHQCEVCEKIYTRAEHLRRHQQNHKPGAFPCDVKGCGKSFYREDLLSRHKAKQHDDPLDPNSTIHPTRSQSSEPYSDISAQLPPPINVEEQVHYANGSDVAQTNSTQLIDSDQRERKFGISTQKHTGQSTFLHSRSPPIPVITQGYSTYDNGGYTSDSSLSYSLSDRASPHIHNATTQPYYSHPARTRHSSNPLFLEPVPRFHRSPSPVSAGSSTIHPSNWANNCQNVAFQYYEPLLDSSLGYTNSIGARSIADVTGIGSLPDQRDLAEQAELSLHMDSPQSSTWSFDMDDDSTTQDDNYLAAYWYWIHPLFSVVHKMSFNPHTVSPLLKAAMLALGADALGGSSDRTYARLVHERCMKVMKRRALNPPDSLRICDMQAIVLIEVYSVFKSRRPPLQFSRHFEDVYSVLANDPEAFDANTVKAHIQPSALDSNLFKDEFAERLLHSYYIECKQRLLLTCYMLDQQHAILFGRSRSKSYLGNGTDLPLPRPQALWDGNVPGDFLDWPACTIGDQYHVTQPVHDAFQSIITIGSLFESKTRSTMDYNLGPEEDITLLTIVGQSPRTELAYHTFALCANTSLRSLLAVVGESWVMTEKLGREEEYTKAQVAAWNWAMGHTMPKARSEPGTRKSEVQLALTHALNILRLQQENEKTGLPFQEWSIYLASIVVWARAHVLSDDRQLNCAPSSIERRLSLSSLDRVVSATIESGASSSISLEDAMSILLWTQKKIASADIPHNCGLTNSVLDVLSRLVMRGEESSWFGK